MIPASAPIGVFDSGLGGLTVASELIRLMPSEDIVYLGDTARVPYGVRSPETVRRYASEGAAFLLGRGIKFLVIACNTVSAVGLDAIIERSSVPVIGVIGPGARAAVSASSSGRVGVIGTEATVRSGAYPRAIVERKKDMQVFAMPCPLFVPLVEEGWLDGDVPRLVAERYLADISEAGIDALVLGCTHYPLLKPLLSEVMGPGIKLIDSATETAKEVRARLDGLGLLREASEGHSGRLDVFVTDSPDKFKAVGGRFLGREIESIEKIELMEVSSQ